MDIFPLMTEEAYHRECEVFVESVTFVDLLNDLVLLIDLYWDFVVDIADLVLGNHFVGADCTVYHLFLSIDLLKGFDCDLDFFVEIGIRLFLVICFVVGICPLDGIYLSDEICLLNEIGI